MGVHIDFLVSVIDGDAPLTDYLHSARDEGDDGEHVGYILRDSLERLGSDFGHDPGGESGGVMNLRAEQLVDALHDFRSGSRLGHCAGSAGGRRLSRP